MWGGNGGLGGVGHISGFRYGMGRWMPCQLTPGGPVCHCHITKVGARGVLATKFSEDRRLNDAMCVDGVGRRAFTCGRIEPSGRTHPPKLLN